MTARPVLEPVLVAGVVTALVTLASAFLPDRFVATAVGLIFFGATWILVWRRDDEEVRRAGLAFGGAILRGPLSRRDVARAALVALAWAVGAAAVVFAPFYAGWRLWAGHVWHVHRRFALSTSPADAFNEIAGQLVIIALPEEAFYRGYLQSQLDQAWAPRWRVFGANVGPALLVTSVIFALGHIATQHDPARLAVFFPSLLFGWMRARTRGVGAGIVLHAACNLFSETLMRGYGLHG
jgi:membrane protease YdiL (CAAX protease family)